MLKIHIRPYSSIVAVMLGDEFNYLTLVQKDTAECHGL